MELSLVYFVLYAWQNQETQASSMAKRAISMLFWMQKKTEEAKKKCPLCHKKIKLVVKNYF